MLKKKIMIYHNEICDLSTLFILCSLTLCIVITYSSFNTGENKIRFVNHRGNKHAKQNTQIIKTTTNFESTSLMTRTKRELKKYDLKEKNLLSTTEITKSESEVQVTRPAMDCFLIGMSNTILVPQQQRLAYQNSPIYIGPPIPFIPNSVPIYCPYASYLTTTRPFEDREPQCPKNMRQCKKRTHDGQIKCINNDKWCNSVVDCPDASDENNCSCRDRINKNKICDNYYDCPQGEDELGCVGCPKDTLHCLSVKLGDQSNPQCYKKEDICNGIEQCDNGKDEEYCSILSKKPKKKTITGLNKGFLHKNLRGMWYPVCGYAYKWAKEACTEFLTSSQQKINVTIIGHADIGPYLTETKNLVDTCNNQITYVECPPQETGRRFVGSSRSFKESSNEDDPIVGIVGGRESKPLAWPYVVALRKNGHFFCGGVIISKSWILTAAHCMVEYKQYYYEIVAGILRLSSYPSSLQIRHPNNIIIHPDFDETSMINDIALLSLDEPLDLGTNVASILLPKSESSKNYKGKPVLGEFCKVVGWGAMDENGTHSDNLREVDVPIINCVHNDDIHKSNICAGYDEGKRDSCQGDSGGPLFCRVSDDNYDTWYVGGLVSHGRGCAAQHEPGVYTKVSHFVDWITSMTRKKWNPQEISKMKSKCPGFKCNKPYDYCLNGNKRCNNYSDCYKGEDEVNCNSVNSRWNNHLNRWKP